MKWKVTIKNAYVLLPIIKYKNNQKYWFAGKIYLNKELVVGQLNFKSEITVQLLIAFQS